MLVLGNIITVCSDLIFNCTHKLVLAPCWPSQIVMSGLVLADIIARTNSTAFTRLSINFSFGRWGEDDYAVVEDTVITRNLQGDDPRGG